MSDPSQSKYAMRQIFDEALSLFEQKNTDYGDAWREQGWRGNLSRILEKARRLKTVLWHGGPIGFAVAEEGARQTALDMINTLAFFIINHDERREWGHEPAIVLNPDAPPWVTAPDAVEPKNTSRPTITVRYHNGEPVDTNYIPATPEEFFAEIEGESENLKPSPAPRRRVKDQPQA